MSLDRFPHFVECSAHLVTWCERHHLLHLPFSPATGFSVSTASATLLTFLLDSAVISTCFTLLDCPEISFIDAAMLLSASTSFLAPLFEDRVAASVKR
ncbi:hypothetical protein EB796_019807 [Bugula neritina]|uniref:Uncharacterized protein n=1 Tax=Bugula neritina TaxID=10212 RepID=A0A7J7J7Z7_BUGNE|nr:hypothetical protein EB796_019807 [Bugula neritina]